MIDIAIQMLYGDRAKYALLISGVCFGSVLMAQGLAMFFGILSFSYATLTNVRSEIWVVDPMVEQVADNQPLKDTDVDRVRSVEGVAWAAPLYSGQTQARTIANGETKPVTLVGLDASTLAGAPRNVVQGNVEDLRRSQTVVIDTEIAARLGSSKNKPLQVGDVFEMNDQRAQVVAVVRTAQGQAGASYVFTTFDRAKDYGFSQRKMTTHILAGSMPSYAASQVADRIFQDTGLRAYTESEFRKASSDWMVKNSPVVLVVGFIVGIGFLVGTVVAGQTFYSFVLENLRFLGALKAMGSTNRSLVRMTVVQALLAGMTGYGIGMGILTVFFSLIPEGKVPLQMKWQVALVVFIAVILIIAISSLLGVRRVLRIDPADVFRT